MSVPPSVQSVSAVRGFSTSSPGAVVLVSGYYKSGDGGGGEFHFDDQDTTSPDDGGSVIVSADGGRWKRTDLSSLTVRHFGAIGARGGDDTFAFNRCIAFANERGSSNFNDVPGFTFGIPDGGYPVGALDPITVSGVEFVGSSRNGAALLLTPGTNTFTFGNGSDIVVGGGVSRVKLEYLTSPLATSAVFVFDHAYRISVSSCLTANIGVLARLGVSASRACGGIVFSGIEGSKANTSCGLYEVKYGAGLFLDSVRVFVTTPHPVHPESMTTVDGATVFKCFYGFWDTVQVSNCIFERFDIGLGISAASGMVYQNFYFTNTIMDYFKRWCIYAESSAGGVIAGIRTDNTSWFVSWETECVDFLGAGYNDNHELMGKIVIAGRAGVKYALMNSKNVTLNGMQINSVNRLGTATAAIEVAAGAKGISILGCTGNVDTTGVGFQWRAPFGVSIGVNADEYLVSGNRLEGSTGGYSISANSYGSSSRLVSGNAKANYSGAPVLALAGPGVPVVNTTPYKVDVHIFGGVVQGISRSGHGIPNMVAGSLSIDPGESVTINYTSPPSFSAFARS